jgi:hypothetical protein
MADHDRLERLDDGSIAFRAADGKRWRHRDIETSRTGPGYRLFISDTGEQRQCTFGPGESHDTTLLDLREQLARAQPFESTTARAENGGEARA